MKITAAGAATASTLGLSACGSGDSGDDEVTLKLVVAEYGATESDSVKLYWNPLISEFQNKYPGIKIDLQVISWKDVDAQVKQMAKDGNPPDLAQMGAYAPYAADDQLYSSDQLLSLTTQANFVPPIAEAGEVNRVQFGLPFVASSRLIFYNKKLFSDAGLDPEAAPENWEELKSAAEALDAIGVKAPYGLPLGPEEAQAETLCWLVSGGGGYTDDLGSYTIDSERNVQTLDWVRKNLVGAGLTNANPSKTDREQIFQAFMKGEVGMIFGHPTLMRGLREEKIEFGIGKEPLGRENSGDTAMGVADWMMAFNKNGKRAQIGKFLDFVFSDENVLKFTKQYDLLPTTVSAVDKMSADPEHKDLLPFLEQLDTATFYPQKKTSWAAVSEALKKQVGKAAEPGGPPVIGVLERVQGAAQTAATQEE